MQRSKSETTCAPVGRREPHTCTATTDSVEAAVRGIRDVTLNRFTHSLCAKESFSLVANGSYHRGMPLPIHVAQLWKAAKVLRTVRAHPRHFLDEAFQLMLVRIQEISQFSQL